MDLRAIDALIAEKVMGTMCLCEKDDWGMPKPGYGTASGYCHKCGNPPDQYVLRYSTDPAAAKQVREKLATWPFSKRQAFLSELQKAVSQRCAAGLIEREGRLIAWPDLYLFVEPVDECVAALRSVGIDTEVLLPEESQEKVSGD